MTVTLEKFYEARRKGSRIFAETAKEFAGKLTDLSGSICDSNEVEAWFSGSAKPDPKFSLGELRSHHGRIRNGIPGLKMTYASGKIVVAPSAVKLAEKSGLRHRDILGYMRLVRAGVASIEEQAAGNPVASVKASKASVPAKKAVDVVCEVDKIYDEVHKKAVKLNATK